jgi:hypothetical protein
MESPDASLGLGGTRALALEHTGGAGREDDIDPFLRAESSDEEDGPAGYAVGASRVDDAGADDDDDDDESVSDRGVRSGRSGRDAEEGLGSGLGRLFGGSTSDLF